LTTGRTTFPFVSGSTGTLPGGNLEAKKKNEPITVLGGELKRKQYPNKKRREK